ncbi:TPA: hypothetical protein ACJHGQ_004393, partial [Yersinia enterocolitica]
GIYLYCFEKELALNISTNKIDIDVLADALKIKTINLDSEKSPTHLQIVFYALLAENNGDSKYFSKPTPEQKKIWDGRVIKLLRSSYGDTENLCEIIAQSVDELQLK